MIELWQAVGLAIITVGGSVAAARIAGKSSVKVKELDVTSQAYTQADGITKGVIELLRQQIKDIEEDRKADKVEHQEQLAKRDVRLDTIEREVGEVRDHNNALITFAYRLIAIARKYGHESEIPTPPPHGIHL